MSRFLFTSLSPESVSESVVLLADEWLLQLPLEALKTFAVPQITSISRDFSLQFHYHRVHPAERSGKIHTQVSTPERKVVILRNNTIASCLPLFIQLFCFRLFCFFLVLFCLPLISLHCIASLLVSLKELCHDILSHFWEVQNHLQIEESLKIIVY